MQGFSVGKATTTALLGRVRVLSGISAGLATAGAVLGRKRSLLGTSAGRATTALFHFLRNLTASAAGRATTSAATIAVWRQLEGSAAGSSTTSASLEALRALAGLSAGRAVTSGDVQALPNPPLPIVIARPQLPPRGQSSTAPAYPGMGVTDDADEPAVRVGIVIIPVGARSGSATNPLSPSRTFDELAFEDEEFGIGTTPPQPGAAERVAAVGIPPPYAAIVPQTLPYGGSSSTATYPRMEVASGAVAPAVDARVIVAAGSRSGSAVSPLNPDNRQFGELTFADEDFGIDESPPQAGEARRSNG